jgi:cbb3-type cytochrome oxidase subunit 3
LIFNIFVNPIALGKIGWRYYIVFVVILVLYGVTVFFFYPETKGHTLEQMTLVFDGQDAAESDEREFGKEKSEKCESVEDTK